MTTTDKELIQLVKSKDREFFQERGLPYPLFWYGYTKLPKNRRRSRAYSVEMRELSELTLDELEFVEMFWAMTPINVKKLKEASQIPELKDFIENIPAPTATRINALIQTKLAMLNSDERKEWADRVEGKAVSREVSMSLTSTDEENSTSATKELILSKFEELGGAWSDYGKDVPQEQLNYKAVQSLEAPKEDGEV